MTLRKSRTIIANGVIVLIAIGLLSAALEVCLALVQLNSRANIRFVPGRGITYVPGASYIHRKEGFSRGRFNSHGFRDRERVVQKAKGVFRIAVLGDSYVEALQVPLGDSFPSILETSLSTRLDRVVEVLGFGQSGFGALDSLMRYKHFVSDYEPDLVIVTVTTGNDFRNGHPVLDRGRVGFYGTLLADGTLEIDSSRIDAYERDLSWGKKVFQAIRRRSYLISLISERLYLLRRSAREEAMSDPLAGGVLGDFSDLNVYRDDAGPLWVEAYEIARRTLGLLRREVAQDGSRLALVALTNAEQVHPEIAEELEDRYGAIFDWERPNKFLARVAAEEGIPFLDLVPAFRRWYRETGQPLHGFGQRRTGHWNEAGHRLAAETLERFLHEEGLLSGRESQAGLPFAGEGSLRYVGRRAGSRYISAFGRHNQYFSGGDSAARLQGDRAAATP